MSIKPTVGFIGLGNMGWHMSRHLVRAGFPVVGLDVDADLMARFKEVNPEAEVGPEGFATADIIVTMLPTSKIVFEALVGEKSAIRNLLRPGTLVIDMSSSQPLDTRDLGIKLTERGLHIVDAPVSGGTQGAEKATLTIMLGADNEADAERALPVIEAVSARIFRVGKLGSGHAMKSLNNYVAAAGFVAAGEALIAAKAYGLDPNVFIDVLNVSTGHNFSTEVTVKQEVITGRYLSGFPLALMTKDVGIASDLAQQLGTTSVLAQTVVQQLTVALDVLGPTADHTAAVKVWANEV